MADNNVKKKLGEINLSGWWTIPGVIVILLGFYYYYNSMHSSIKSPRMTEQIEYMIKSDYLSKRVEEVKEKLEEGTLTEEEAGHIDVYVSIESIDIKGLFSGEKHIRVKAFIDGEPPPDGTEYWYFRAKYSFLWGWRQPIESFEAQYRRKWL